MNLPTLARHYANYWSGPGQISDNAPDALRDFLRVQPRTTERFAVHKALQQLGNMPATEQAALAYTAGWIVARPYTYLLCDEILRSKKPPQTFADLIDRAYSTAQQDVTDSVRDWLKQQLADT